MDTSFLSQDTISADGIRFFLSPSFVAPNFFIHDCLESTNKTAKEMATSLFKHGTVLIANEQTGGKGRFQRDFFCKKDCGIYLTFMFKPENLAFSNTSIVTAFLAVAVCKAIEKTTEKNPKIKWVNDILLEDKKICGILTETVIKPGEDKISAIIAGIGINFSIPSKDFPQSLQHSAGSLFEDGAPLISRNQLIAEIINQILSPEATISDTLTLQTYKSYLSMLGKNISIKNNEETIAVTALDIDGTGRLIVKNSNDEILALSSGEVIL